MKNFYRGIGNFAILVLVACSSKAPEENPMPKKIVSSISKQDLEAGFVPPPPLSAQKIYSSFKDWAASLPSDDGNKSEDSVYNFKLFTMQLNPAIYVLNSDNVRIDKAHHMVLVGGSYVLSKKDFPKSTKQDLINAVLRHVSDLINAKNHQTPEPNKAYHCWI